MNKKANGKLPKYGYGPLYLICSSILTILSLLYFNKLTIFQSGIIENYLLRKCFLILSIYSGIYFVLVGILMMTFNIFIFIVAFIIYGFLTILLIYTEEKWCLNKFGKEYEVYCHKVNRIIPWFPKNN